jgi:hypothetical protein
MDYGEVFTVTLAAGGGFVAVNVSAGATYFGGLAEAGIGGTGTIKNVPVILVTTHGETSAIAAAATIGGGAVAVNAGMALAINRTVVKTYIGDGVTIQSSPDITLISDFDSNAYALILGSITGGGVAVGVSVAIAINSASVYTYIGVDPTGAQTRQRRAP